MLWLLLGLVAAVATSFSTIFAKIGIKNVNSNIATVFRTGIVVVFCLILCILSGNIKLITNLTYQNWLFIIISGLSTGCSWLCYYKALQLGQTNKIVAIDKSSFVLTSILFLIFFFDDTTKGGNILIIVAQFVSICLMLIGTIMMIYIDKKTSSTSKKWLIYALLSAAFASLVSFFIKLGLYNIPTDVGTLIRTIIVFIFATFIVLIFKDYKKQTTISKTSLIFLTLSSLATGCAWLLEYYSLSLESVNPIAINSIGKLSILLTMLFSYTILKEKFTKKAIIGLIILTIGIINIIVFSL